jgi:hypothetical protein
VHYEDPKRDQVLNLWHLAGINIISPTELPFGPGHGLIQGRIASQRGIHGTSSAALGAAKGAAGSDWCVFDF